MASQGKLTGVRGVSWREQETADLIAIWGDEKIQAALAKSHKNMEVFETVARKMQSLGYPRSALECRTKTKALRADYRVVVSMNKETGRAPSTCPFFRELDAILHGDGSARPKRLSRPTRMRPASDYSLQSQTTSPSVCSTQPRPLSQLLFHRDLITIDAAGLRCSTPVNNCAPPLDPPTDRMAEVSTGGHDSTSVSEPQALPEAEQMDDEEVGELPCDASDNHDPEGQSGQENVPPPQPPLAELGAEERLAIMRRRPRVAVLSDISRRLIQQSRIEHREIMQKIDEEGERDRALMERNLRIMESAVDVMADIRDIFRQRLVHVPVGRMAQQPPLAICSEQTRGLQLAPVQQEDTPEVLVEDTQPLLNEGNEAAGTASQSILGGRASQRGSQRVRVITHVQGTNSYCPRERRCRGQKRERYSPS